MDRVAIRPWMAWSGLAALLLLLGGFLIWLQSEPEPAPDLGAESVRMALTDIRLVHGKAGSVLWELSAAEGAFHQDTGSVDLRKPEFVFRMREEGQRVLVRAPCGALERDRQAVRLWPRVVVDYGQARLSADTMEYAESEQALVFSGHVRLRDPRMTVRSRRARFELQNRDLVLKDEVRVVLQ